ncbi:hypothetical protein SLEP1_g28355 [Rubroshorea leprosula]|uniref:Uncharacterized protein n=1 Tax=Rubroshorea leprosula TaxID=152421 RepID=A0AAV5JZ24_9ROSI|nr:hypothetical protein SLEP1_g28355 [Rubroshorea leprosula]
MGRKPCCAKEGLNKGAWTEREDCILRNYINLHGDGKWRDLPQRAGLKRCGKSCRLRWLNYLRPDIKRGNVSADEEELIIRLHNLLGNRWSLIAGRLPGRTDNEIKNYWNTKLSKRALQPQQTDHQDHFKIKLKAEKGGLKDRAAGEEDTTEPLKQVIRTKAVRCTKAVVSVLLQLESLVPAKSDIREAEESPFSLAVGDQDNDQCIDFLKDLDIDELVLTPDVNVGSSCREIGKKAVKCIKAAPAALELENLLVPSNSDMSKADDQSPSLYSSTVGYHDKDECMNFLMDLDINELLVPGLNMGTCRVIGTEAVRCIEGIVPAELQLESLLPSKSEMSMKGQSPSSLEVEDHNIDKCIDFLKDLDIEKVFIPDVNVGSSCGDIQTKVPRCTEAVVPATLELQNLFPSKSDMIDVNERQYACPPIQTKLAIEARCTKGIVPTGLQLENLLLQYSSGVLLVVIPSIRHRFLGTVFLSFHLLLAISSLFRLSMFAGAEGASLRTHQCIFACGWWRTWLAIFWFRQGADRVAAFCASSVAEWCHRGVAGEEPSPEGNRGAKVWRGFVWKPAGWRLEGFPMRCIHGFVVVTVNGRRWFLT